MHNGKSPTNCPRFLGGSGNYILWGPVGVLKRAGEYVEVFNNRGPVSAINVKRIRILWGFMRAKRGDQP